MSLRTQLQQAQLPGFPSPLNFGLGLAVLILGAAVFYLWRLRNRDTRVGALTRPDSPEAVGHDLRSDAPASKDTAGITSPGDFASSSVAVVPEALAAQAMSAKDLPSALMEALQASLKPVPALHEQTQAFARLGAGAGLATARYLPSVSALDRVRESGAAAPAKPKGHCLPELHAGYSSSAAGSSMAGSSSMSGGHDVSVEELIDVTQQAEFCVALGQDEAAIELLQDFVRSAGGGCALPHLMVLEIYKRLGDQFSYALVREGFNQRFGMLPPAWDENLSGGAGLEADASLLERMQRCWDDHGTCMDLLQRLLVPARDDQPGMQSAASSLSLSASLDLLLLYCVARDLSVHEVRGNEVDVFLPLEHPDGSAFSTSMMATLPRPLVVWPGAPIVLDLDLSGGDGAAAKP